MGGGSAGLTVSPIRDRWDGQSLDGAIGGMADLVAFFNTPWPQRPGDPAPTSGAGDMVGTVALIAAGLVVFWVAATRLLRLGGPRRPA